MLNVGLGLAKQIESVARRAGQEIMRIYETDFDIEAKGDKSPVTKADKIAEEQITRAIIEGVTADFPVVGEEAARGQCFIGSCIDVRDGLLAAEIVQGPG